MLTATAFGGLTRRMLAVADELCGGRPAVIQEGGSSPIYVPFCGAMTLAALLGMESPAGDVPGANAKEAQALTPWQRDAVDAALRALDG